jgi:hypothetical protein
MELVPTHEPKDKPATGGVCKALQALEMNPADKKHKHKSKGFTFGSKRLVHDLSTRVEELQHMLMEECTRAAMLEELLADNDIPYPVRQALEAAQVNGWLLW